MLGWWVCAFDANGTTTFPHTPSFPSGPDVPDPRELPTTDVPGLPSAQIHPQPGQGVCGAVPRPRPAGVPAHPECQLPRVTRAPRLLVCLHCFWPSVWDDGFGFPTSKKRCQLLSLRKPKINSPFTRWGTQQFVCCLDEGVSFPDNSIHYFIYFISFYSVLQTRLHLPIKPEVLIVCFKDTQNFKSFPPMKSQTHEQRDF